MEDTQNISAVVKYKLNKEEYKDIYIIELERELNDYKQELANKQAHIELLLARERELERIFNSRSWRMMRIPWAIRDIVLPKNSKRRLVIKLVLQFIRHPIKFLKKINRNRIKRFLDGVEMGTLEDTADRLNKCMSGEDVVAKKLNIIRISEKENATAADYQKFLVPTSHSPLVSIIIPVYNQFHYTYTCLKSIAERTGDIDYEIIIANDCSTDLTRELTDIISGVKVITNETNLRFLRNCNNAAKQAKGKYILFLNNDTQVQEDWLRPLITLIESKDDIGMVGSKLLYPDGRLQEAGGILWKDGSAWNYGHCQDPSMPEFNYVKEADYISGASIMIKADLWKELGGFDDNFAPAYCEDSDLAFSVRKAGYKVLFQPQSAVVHFEGISNGTDTSTGQKAYQIINQKKFYDKWKDVLEAEHNPNAVDPFRARDKSLHRKTILMVDHYVPTFDKDAGSRTVFQYLKLFVDHGYNVKFIGDNFAVNEPYTTTLEQMGIEVLCGTYYSQHWKDWIVDNAAAIDYVFLNRPHIAVKYIDWIKDHTNARIIYYGHDLHFLRVMREYELNGDKKLLKESEDWKEKELSLMRKSDVTYYPSEVEIAEIHKIDPSINAKAIPAYLFSDIEKKKYDFESRHDLMFIGGYNHKPNVDAVLWLANAIVPELVKLIPDIKIYIMGSNAPKEVMKAANANIIYVGMVSDEELANYYDNCRLSVVPLRYGAGIKGKVVEAMEKGVPVMTTSIGAEGITGAEDILVVEDDAVKFAHRLAEVYKDKKKLCRISAASYEYIENNYSPDNAVRVVGSDFDML